MNQFLARRSPNILGSISQLSSNMDNLMNSFFEDDFFRDELSMSKSVSRLPKINVREEDTKYVVEANVAGIEKKDLKISFIGDNSISIQYSKQDKKEENGERYLIRELSGRSFERVIPFFESIDRDSIKAKIENGVLKVEVSKIALKTPEEKQVVIE